MSGPEKNECDHETRIANTNYRIAAAHFAKANSTVRAQVAEITRLRAEVARLDEALAEIADPVAAMKARADKEGARIDGGMANFLANDVGYLKGVARAARMPAEGRAALKQDAQS